MDFLQLLQLSQNPVRKKFFVMGQSVSHPSQNILIKGFWTSASARAAVAVEATS
jgi:hypothetical protein